MTMTRPPLHHIVRVRRTEDLSFLRTGVMDEVAINANLVENGPDTTATAMRETTLPFSIDPVLTRFQMPEWWRNAKGETKRNYKRLGEQYVRGTTIQLPAGPLVQTVPTDDEWRTLARNVVDYQRSRLDMPTQLDLLAEDQPRQLRPVRLNAPALVAFTSAEDRVNRLMAEASAETAELPLAVPVIVPLERLAEPRELEQLLSSVPSDGVSSYSLWTPGLTEERLLSDRNLFAAVLRLVTGLAERNIPVGHLHATYAIAALHDVGVAAVTHTLGWVDRGEPAHETGGGPRSCNTYVPAVRRCLRFERAYELGRSLDAAQYGELYCSCAFCSGAFEAGEHPLDLLLEEDTISMGRGRERGTPTSRATGLNTWHYALSRRQEIEAFSGQPAMEVIERDLQRAADLAGRRGTDRLQRLADGLRTA
jgi:hypothetical protein